MVDSLKENNISATNIKEIIAKLKFQTENSANILCKPKPSSQVGNILIDKDSESNINSKLEHKCSTTEELNIKRKKLSSSRAITEPNKKYYNVNHTRDRNTASGGIWDILKTLKASKDIGTTNHQDNSAVNTITTRELYNDQLLQNDIHEQRESKNHKVNNCKRLKFCYDQGNQSSLTKSCIDTNVDEPSQNRNSYIKQLIKENSNIPSIKLNDDSSPKRPSCSQKKNHSYLNSNKSQSDISFMIQRIKHGKNVDKNQSKLSATKQKSNTLQNRFENKTTFDDFCTNVINTIYSKSDANENIQRASTSLVKENIPKLSKKENLFPKSCSTGYIDEKRINNKNELNSLPITDFEIKSRRERIKKNKVNFDDFVQNIVREINNSGKTNDSHLFQEKTNLKSFKNRSKVEEEIQNCNDNRSTTIQNKSREIIEDDTFADVRNLNFLGNSHDMIQTSIETNTSDVENIAVGKNTDVNYKSRSVVYSEQIDEGESEDLLYTKDSITSKPSIKGITEHNDIIQQEFQVDISTEEVQNFTNTIYRPRQMSECSLDKNFTETSHFLGHSLLKDNMLGSALSEDPKFCMSTENEGMVTDTEEFLGNSGGLLEDGMVNFVLPNSGQDSKKDSEVVNRGKLLEEFFENLKKENEHNVSKTKKRTELVQKKKSGIRRYKKGKMRIYKIKSLKKPKLSTDVKELVEENLNFNDIFKKITQNIVETECKSPLSKSMSSVSTPSSYITDFTKSEILSTGSNELNSPQQRLRKGINELSKDKSLLCLEKEWEESASDNKDELKMKIQEICLKIGEDFLEKQQSSFKYRRQSFDNCIFKDGRLQLKPLGESSMTVVKSTALRSHKKFKLILYILKKIRTLLETNTKLTKRELYYQLKTFVNDQSVIDRIINSISSLLNVGMWTLNIIAQKGLVFGNLKILLSSGETLNCNIPGTLIPQDVNEIVEIHSLAYFILVVEKESIFYKLIEEGLPERLTRPFIMITGKGFPDLNTQLFLKKLWMIMSIPVFILVDADPHGINIMLNYRFGSVNNAHVSHHLAVPNAKWLGVYPSEVVNLNLTKELLSERELKLVDHLLRTPYVEGNARIVAELKVLLEKKYKAEIEGLIKTDTFLSDVYLPNKFFTHNFI